MNLLMDLITEDDFRPDLHNVEVELPSKERLMEAQTLVLAHDFTAVLINMGLPVNYEDMVEEDEDLDLDSVTALVDRWGVQVIAKQDYCAFDWKSRTYTLEELFS